jgi:2-succinyl-5-enolpyruvyl-6-hydroxy-3-cyclohexene-1-carboxylate synthase
VEDAIISPGSRNAPMIVALARNPHIHCHSIVDERSAGFVGLGMAKANSKPVVLCCTSGTALLNYYPAIAEAFYSGVPLIVLSADRPPELIDNWDGQCIRQEMVFDNHIVANYSIPSYADKEDCLEEIEEIIQAAMQDAIFMQGPVHINAPMREPLYGEIPEGFSFKKGEVIIPIRAKSHLDLNLDGYTKILVLNGAEYKKNSALALALNKIITNNKAVVLNDIISNQNEETLKGYDALLLKADSNDYAPEVLITTGKFVLSKSLKTYLRKYKPKKHIHLCEIKENIGDPFDSEPQIIEGGLAENLEKITQKTTNSSDYISYWLSQNKKHEIKQNSFFQEENYAEFKACFTIANSIKKESIIHLANSTTVRYFSYLKSFLDNNEIHANRGTSGIDGCSSTVVGFALASSKERITQPEKEHILITGDVAFFYDINALWNNKLPKNLKIILLNNGGGGIFRYINGPNKLGELEEFFETAHNRTAENTAKEFGIEYLHSHDQNSLITALQNFYNNKNRVILEVFTDKYKNEIQFNKFKEL